MLHTHTHTHTALQALRNPVATPRFRLKYDNWGAVRAPVHPVHTGVPVSVL
jgi:hypothetical protein